MNSFVRSLKNIFPWKLNKSPKKKEKQDSLLFAGFIGVFEDALFWRNIWLSLSFIFMINVIVFVCAHRQINMLGFIFSFSATTVCIDAIEAWLKFKHRTSCLKRLATHDGNKLCLAATQFSQWFHKKWAEFVYLRETNHTKAFILVNIIFGTIFAIGIYVNGYVLTYLLCMFLCFSNKIVYPLLRLYRNIHADIESEHEFEGLIPEISEINIKLLSIEPEQKEAFDEKQSLDYWRPVDVPLEEASDSSDNSSSLVTNFSMEKLHTLEGEVETSDSSDDEYIPMIQQKEQLQSTLEVVEPSNSWSNSAYNTFWSLTGAVTNLMSADLSLKTKRKRVSSSNSSDGFEMIDKKDIH